MSGFEEKRNSKIQSTNEPFTFTQPNSLLDVGVVMRIAPFGSIIIVACTANYKKQ